MCVFRDKKVNSHPHQREKQLYLARGEKGKKLKIEVKLLMRIMQCGQQISVVVSNLIIFVVVIDLCSSSSSIF